MNVILGTAFVYYQAPRHFNTALGLFQQVLKRSPNNSRALIGKALIYEEEGRVEESLAVLNAIIKDYPDNIQASIEASWCQILLGQHEEGRSGLQRCLALITGEDPLSLELKAKICWRIGKSQWDSDGIKTVIFL